MPPGTKFTSYSPLMTRRDVVCLFFSTSTLSLTTVFCSESQNIRRVLEVDVLLVTFI
jgi:hypothetical protein